MKTVTTIVSAVALASVAQGASLSLASTMDGNSSLSENFITGSLAQINFGSGGQGDDDGFYDVTNTANQFGSSDIFPNETAFTVGSIDYSDDALTGSGIETTAITGIDLSGITSDISNLGDWWFGAPAFFSFGALDASDTISFIDGAVSSVGLSIDAAFNTVDGQSNLVTWNGTFSVSGNDISLSITDTQIFNTGPFGGNNDVPSTFTADLGGTVNAIPEPTSTLLCSLGLGMFVLRRKRS